MANRLTRVHADDFAYLKGLYGGNYIVKIDGNLFISIEQEDEAQSEDFYSGTQWSEAEINRMRELEMDQEKIQACQKREEFRAKMADLGRAEETNFNSKVLEAYDLIHCPELRAIKVSFSTDKYPNGLFIEVDGQIIYQSKC